MLQSHIMDQSLPRLNTATGAVTLTADCTFLKTTTLQELIFSMGHEKAVQRNEFMHEVSYVLDGLDVGSDRLFSLHFYFTSVVIGRVNMYAYDPDFSWDMFKTEAEWAAYTDGNRDAYMTWVRLQTGDTSAFVWDGTPKAYELHYAWGSIGVYFDFKNGDYSIYITYS